MTNAEIIAVVQAAERGEEIEFRDYGSHNEWKTLKCKPAWNFTELEYRVKPNPLVLWCNVYEHGGGVKEAYGYETKEKAERAASRDRCRVAVRMVEQPE